MQSSAKCVRVLIPLTFMLLYCWGCAVPSGPSGKSPRTGDQPGGPQSAASAQGPGSPLSPKKANQIISLSIQDGVDDTTIRMTGSTPFQDYEFQRMGEDRFTLDLGDVSCTANRPVVPASSSRVILDYAASATGSLQLTGTVSTPLDYYVVDSLGNDLIVTLYFSKETPPAHSYPLEQAPGRLSRDEPPVSRTYSESSPVLSGRAGVPGPESQRVLTSPEPQRVPSPLPQATRALEPTTGTGVFRKPYTGKPISLDLMDADLRNVLRLISDITGSNIVIEPDVAGRVTLKVEQVPWDQVLDMVLSMNNLGREQVGNVIRIARQEKLRQEWNQQTEEIKAKQELLEVAKDWGELSTVYLTVNYAQPTEIAGKITENKSERGKVSVDERSSLIIYTDYPSRIENARHLLARLDKATSQVLIEARIVTMNAERRRDLGVDWGLRFSHVGANSPNLRRDFQVNSPSADLFGFSVAEVFGETLMNLDFRLSALETANQLNVVAAPKVLTINHVKATVTQGSQIPYLVVSGESAQTSTEFKDATVELQVTPHITPDQKVRLEIQAKQDEPSGSFQVGQSTVPGIDTRKISTELLVDDGNIVVIGGVIRNRDSVAETSTPGLSKVPVLGRLFKKESVTSQKTELLIFISPKIVEPSRANVTQNPSWR